MRALMLTVLIIGLVAGPVLADNSELGEGRWYTLYSSDNKVLLRTGISIHVGDRFLDSDNRLYEVYRVDEDRFQAWASEIAKDTFGNVMEAQGLPGADNKIIAVYHTHSGESYLPSDGVDSTDSEPGGVYRVGEELSARFEKDGGIKALHCEETFFPYSGAYRRSRNAAIDLVETGDIDAIFDVHRDAAPKDEYYQEIDDMSLTQVMLVVGAQNPTKQTNEEFAWQLKEVADSMYPQLVKGIFYARGGYNQDLHPRALLLEFGAHTNLRQEAEVAARAFADVVYVTLYGPLPLEEETEIEENPQLASTADPAPGSKGGILKGLFSFLALLSFGAGSYLFISTGSWSGVKETLTHFFTVEFRDLFSSIPWRKLLPSYWLRQLRELKIGSGAPANLRFLQDWLRRFLGPKNRG